MPARMTYRTADPEDVAAQLLDRPAALNHFLDHYRSERPLYHTEYETAVYQALVDWNAA